MKLIYEKSKKGLKGIKLPVCETAADKNSLARELLRNTDNGMPEVSEPDVIRHFTQLSKMNFSVDSNFYPLGSCTMKYNPKFTEKLACLSNFTDLHPMLFHNKQYQQYIQGSLEIIYNLETMLCEITGMDGFTTQPMAGAHGELTGILLTAAYHKNKKNKKDIVLIPDSGHGTNPASAAMGNYQVKTITSDKSGIMNIEELKKHINHSTAAIMLTCPNTAGIFNKHIHKITDLAHKFDALCYYDGANLNAILGKTRPGDLGFDIVHLNLHKTFATPHGGGGPGSGPVGVKKELIKFLPVPEVEKKDNASFSLNYQKKYSIGKIAPFLGNFLVALKAYAYILTMGSDGLTRASEMAVLNANYIFAKLKKYFYAPFDRYCMHECVLSAHNQAKNGVHATDIAKALIDKGIHPPTVYFPLTVKEALMIEPTETESKQTLDFFIETMIEISNLAEKDPKHFKSLPKNTPVTRPDEVKAVKEHDFCLNK